MTEVKTVALSGERLFKSLLDSYSKFTEMAAKYESYQSFQAKVFELTRADISEIHKYSSSIDNTCEKVFILAFVNLYGKFPDRVLAGQQLESCNSDHAWLNWLRAVIFYNGFARKPGINNTETALKYASRQRDNIFQNYIAGLCLLATGKYQDFHASFALLERAANFGIPEAMCDLAYFYERGIGTHVYPEMAIIWYRKCSEIALPDNYPVMNLADKNSRVLAGAWKKANVCFKKNDFVNATAHYEEAKLDKYSAILQQDSTIQLRNIGEILAQQNIERLEQTTKEKDARIAELEKLLSEAKTANDKLQRMLVDANEWVL